MSTENLSAYHEALQRIRLAHESNASELDLSDLALERLPDELGDMTALQSLKLSGMQAASRSAAAGRPDRLAKPQPERMQAASRSAAAGRPDRLAKPQPERVRAASGPAAAGRPDRLAKPRFELLQTASGPAAAGRPDHLAKPQPEHVASSFRTCSR